MTDASRETKVEEVVAAAMGLANADSPDSVKYWRQLLDESKAALLRDDGWRGMRESERAAFRRGVEAALAAVKAEFDAFCDPRYAVQPLGSTGERFACKQIEARIRAIEEPT